MTKAVSEGALDAASIERIMAPRDGMVLERAEGEGVFSALEGPFGNYRRQVEIVEPPSGSDRLRRVRQTVEFELDIPWFGWMFGWAVRRRLAALEPRHGWPWWSPPERISREGAVALAALCLLSMVTGYLGTILTQTITFAAREFGADKGAQSVALASVRADVVIAVGLVWLADRRGRRSVLLWTAGLGCLVTATGALVPSLTYLAGSQVVARGFVTAAAIMLAIVAAEEMAAGSRAYAVSLLGMSAGFGAGVCVFLLRFADAGMQAWRFLFAAALVGVPVVVSVARRLPESRRFRALYPAGAAGPPSSPGRGPHPRPAPSAAHDPLTAAARSHAGRFWLLAASAFLLNLFFAPASQFGNEYLRTERGFSAGDISLFTILTGVPGAIGVVVGGRLAERGRRLVGAVAVVGGVGATVFSYSTHGWPVWAWSAVGSVVGAATIPALGVYGPELFPTKLRGKANGIITTLGRFGGVMGLLAAGYLSTQLGSLGPALAVLAIGPAVLALLVLVAYPETAHRELEDLNPEDAPLR
ncbi:MAG TPA: MFS transporter [Acidimicrobiales bacterium]|nr:MFS transporter [Acidimicrobiales bacterium]